MQVGKLLYDFREASDPKTTDSLMAPISKKETPHETKQMGPYYFAPVTVVGNVFFFHRAPVNALFIITTLGYLGKVTVII